MNDLKALHCKPFEGQPPLSATELQIYLARVHGWALRNGAIEKSYSFGDFHQTMAFVNALAWIAHVEDHHPDLAVSYNRCTVRYNTHSAGGITISDFICAAKADALQS